MLSQCLSVGLQVGVEMKCQSIQNAENSAFTDEKLVEAVLQSFNTWRFKRSQPSNNGLMKDFVRKSVASDLPLSFVLYWGKGFRSHSGVNEQACLYFLSEMGRRIGEVYAPGAEFDILYTDTHAALNGHCPADVDKYLSCLRADCSEEFFVRRLSDVVAASRVREADMPEVAAEEASEMIAKLVGCAEKWYRGGGLAADGAARYFWMNMLERIAVERVFPGSIFVTFNSSEMRPLFPSSLPVFYMYSVKKGTSVKPWFMDEPDGVCPNGGRFAQPVSA